MNDLIAIFQDTTTVDTVQAVVDSVASGAATAITDEVRPLLVAGLGIVVRFVYEGSRKILTFLNTKSPMIKALAALVWAQLAVFGTAVLPAGAPDIPADIGMLPSAVLGMVVWGLSMGVNTLVDIIRKRWA